MQWQWWPCPGPCISISPVSEGAEVHIGNDTLCSVTKTSQSITVIGAGINGLVAANYLARAGHQVTLLERNDRVGGACVSETVDAPSVKDAVAELGADLTSLWITGSASGNMRRMRTGASTSSGSSRTFPFVAPAPTPAARSPEPPATCASASCCATWEDKSHVR